MSHVHLSTTQSVIGALRHEFDQLGIQIQSIHVEHAMTDIYGGCRGGPSLPSYNGASNLSVQFTCSQAQFDHIVPFVQEVKMRATTIPPPVRLFKPHESSVTYFPTLEHFYDCTMTLVMTGGDMSQFIEAFREQTSDLRYKIESSKFDKEVEKMLTDDGYNN